MRIIKFFRNIFHELKRVISQFFETEYWYRHYKPTLWFNEDKNKFEAVKKPYVGYNPLVETWDGEGSIIHIMVRKIEHMFWSLKKYGNERYWYVHSYQFLSSAATNYDKEWALKQCFERYKNKTEVSFDVNWIGDTVEVWITNDDAPKSISASGLRHYYFSTKDFNTFNVYHYDDIEVDPASIPKSMVRYNLEIKDGKITSTPAKQYRHEAEPVWHLKCVGWADVEDFIQKNFNKSLTDCMIDNMQTFDITPESYKKLSSFIQSKTVGNRQKCKQLLELRRMLLDYYKINDLNDKYCPTQWPEYSQSGNNAELYEKANKMYRNDRHDLMVKIAEFIAEYGDRWWD